MGKREIKTSLKKLIGGLDVDRCVDDTAITEIHDKIDDLAESIEHYNLGIEVDLDELKVEVVRLLLEENEPFGEFKNDLDEVLGECEDWASELSDSKEETAREEFIDPLQEIRDELDDVDWIETADDIATLITDVVDKVKELL